MEENHLSSFEISGFKRFVNLKVENIGQFNLIVGDNNVGKTSLLEALLVDKSPGKFLDSLSNIFFVIKKFRGLTSPFLNYFFSDSNDSSHQEMKFYLKKKNEENEILLIHRDKTSQFKYRQNVRTNQSHASTQAVTLDVSNSNEGNIDFNFGIPYIPFGTLYNHDLTKQYSNNIQLFVDKKERLIESLSHIIMNIKNIEVNASYSNQAILLIAEKNKNKLYPLATYGDGTVKLFRILLSLFSNDYYNRLMIDELDAGVHFSRLKDFIKALVSIAKEQKKQIFATTHSKECIEYFSLALKELELEEEGRIIRLAETASGIKAYTNNYEQFENSLNADSELR